MSIRTKLTIFISLLLVALDALSCLFFYMHEKKEHEGLLIDTGNTLIVMLSRDNEVGYAMKQAQPAFLDAPLKRLRIADSGMQIGYWRISNKQSVIAEGTASWIDTGISEIPPGAPNPQDTPFIRALTTSSGEKFFDFSIPVSEDSSFSEEAFAEQVLDSVTRSPKNGALGFVQIGLTTKRLQTYLFRSVLYTIIPLGAVVASVGIALSFLLTRYLVSPIRRLAAVTQDIAKGDMSKSVDIQSKDEIGLLAANFNDMTRSLGKLYGDLKQEVEGHKRTTSQLQYRLEMEGLVAAISSKFLNLTPATFDDEINCVLEIIGKFVIADRSYVFCLSTDGKKKTINNTHEWCAEGIKPEIGNLQGIAVENFPWWMERIERFEIIHIPRVTDMPACAQAEKDMLQAQSIQSLVIVPMVYSGALIGFLGFDSVRTEKTWDDDDVLLLKLVGEILVNAMEHGRKENSLQEAYQKLEIRVTERTRELSQSNKLLEAEIAGHKSARAELKKYEIFISEINDLPYICDTQGNILFVNHVFDKLTGHKREDFIGKSFAPLFDKENLEKALCFYKQTLMGESPQYELSFKDTGIICEYKNLPLRDEKGAIIGVIGTARDITKQKHIVEALRQAKDYAEDLIETANVMIVGLDVAGNIRVFNETAEKITGYKKTELLGKNCFETLMPQGLSPDAWQAFHAWRTTGQITKSYESQILAKSDKIRVISWQASEVKDRGKITGILSFGNDITEQKQMKSLVERLRLMSFIRDVSVALSEGAALGDILRSCAEAMVRNLDAALARIWTFNEKDKVLELQASEGISTRIDGSYSRVPVGKYMIGIIAQERRPYMGNPLANDPHVNDLNWVREQGITAFLGYPLIFRGRLVGVVAMFSHKEMDDFTIKALSYASDIISLGIDRKQAEESLRMSENKYRMLLESLPQRIFYKDKNSVYVSCNINYARDLHITPGEIEGKTDYDFYPKFLADKYREDDKRVALSGKTDEVDEKYIIDGREMVVHTMKTPIKDEAGSAIGILGIFWDITEKVALEMEAIRTRHLASLGELSAGIAHEINNPLNGIINYAQILLNRKGREDKEADILGKIVKEGHRTATIVKNLLSFARPTGENETKVLARIHEIISSTFALVGAQSRRMGITTKLNFPDTLPAILAHPQQIQQVFLNLISNAQYALCEKYSAPSADKILEVSGETVTIDNATYIKVVFCDHGTGIPPNVIHKITDPFFTTKPRNQGTGLGLSICHGIISDHGGKLLVESEEGKYTRVSVLLPALS